MENLSRTQKKLLGLIKKKDIVLKTNVTLACGKLFANVPVSTVNELKSHEDKVEVIATITSIESQVMSMSGAVLIWNFTISDNQDSVDCIMFVKPEKKNLIVHYLNTEVVLQGEYMDDGCFHVAGLGATT